MKILFDLLVIIMWAASAGMLGLLIYGFIRRCPNSVLPGQSESSHDSRDVAGCGGESRELEWESGSSGSVRAIRLRTFALKNILSVNPVNVTTFLTAKLVNLRTGYGSRFSSISHDNLIVSVHIANSRISLCGFHGGRILALGGAV